MKVEQIKNKLVVENESFIITVTKDSIEIKERKWRSVEKLYYSATDVANLTGVSKGRAYEIIQQMNAMLKKECEEKKIDMLFLQAKVLKSYFDQMTGGVLNERNIKE